MEIRRTAYLDKLIRKRQNGMIKVVTGIRRCGKSYLLFTIFHQFLLDNGVDEAHMIEIALDDRSNISLRDPDNMLRYIKEQITDKQTYYIILDEVQLMDEFVDVLNSLLHIRNADVYVTGSNSKFLSSDIITEFRGRGDEIRVYPLSFREFVSVYEGTKEEAWEDYYTYGGLPLIPLMKTAEDKVDYLNTLFRKVYISDIVERNKVKNKEELDELVDILASAVGSLTSFQKLTKTFKSIKGKVISDKTLKTYTEHLIDAFLISRAKQYNIKGRKYINSPAKYYFEDIGLRNARLNFRQMEETHIMENMIYNELRIRGYSVDVGIVEQYVSTQDSKRSKKRLEVDFVASKGSEKYYIQSALSMAEPAKAAQELRSLLGITDSFKKIVVVRNNVKLRRDEAGIVTMGLLDFLQNENSLTL